MRRELTRDNPFEGLRVGVKAQKQTAPKWLTEKEQRRLLRAVRQYGKRNAARDMALIRLGLNAGLRLSEIAALTLDDIEINDRSGWVRVRFGKGARREKSPFPWRPARPCGRGWSNGRGIPMRMMPTSS